MNDDDAVRTWFFVEIFPLEAALTRFLRRHWKPGEAEDLRQEIYLKIYEAARQSFPDHAKAFLFATARNHLASRVRRSRIVAFDLMADIDALGLADDSPTPELKVVQRDNLRRIQAMIADLPPRMRQIVLLRRIEGVSAREAAARLKISTPTVDQQLARAIRILTERMLEDDNVTPGEQARKLAGGGK